MTARVHDDWATPAFDAMPLAADTGPFTRRPLLQAWWEHRRPPGAALCLAEGDNALLSLHERAGSLAFLGEADLIDYHSPLGDGVPELVAGLAASRPANTRFEFDSLPWDAAEALVKGLREVGRAVEAVEHESAAVLDLPDDYDAYLAAVGKKERHELRRKRRRFEAQLGPPTLETTTSMDALGEFAGMHRAARGDKGDFMTDDMLSFFRALLAVPGARIDVLRDGEGCATAATFGFVDESGFFLYNSAYAPAASTASPGMVLLAMLIEAAIGVGASVFDFLKGDEAYKYRLGARRRPLFEIRSTG